MTSNPSVAYLVNQYPKTSHSFIRREIRALERLGVKVERFSIRSTAGDYVDASDVEEAKRTTVLLTDMFQLARAVLNTAARRPIRFVSALRKTLEFAQRSDRGLASHAAYLAEACLLREHLAKRHVEHVHAHFGTNSAVVASLTRTLGGPEYSFTAHGPEEFDRAAVLPLGPTIEQSKFVAAISEFGRSQLCRQVDQGQWQKIAIVRCGLDDKLLQCSQPPIPESGRLVCVGRLHEQKGQLVLLDAVVELRKRGICCEVILAGDGPLRATLEARIGELALTDSVRITGWLTEAQVLEELAAARALVLPSFAEGLPVVIMEAMALGRPVISTYVAGIPELVVTSETGWLVPAGAVKELADAMAIVLQAAPEALAAIGKRAQVAVRRLHDVNSSAALLKSLFAT